MAVDRDIGLLSQRPRRHLGRGSGAHRPLAIRVVPFELWGPRLGLGALSGRYCSVATGGRSAVSPSGQARMGPDHLLRDRVQRRAVLRGRGRSKRLSPCTAPTVSGGWCVRCLGVAAVEQAVLHPRHQACARRRASCIGRRTRGTAMKGDPPSHTTKAETTALRHTVMRHPSSSRGNPTLSPPGASQGVKLRVGVSGAGWPRPGSGRWRPRRWQPVGGSWTRSART